MGEDKGLKKRKKKEYWSQEQETAVAEYLKMDPESPLANRLFETKIYEPLKKLVENIMFTYRLSVTDIPLDEQIYDAMSFVVWKMRKYDPEKGHKAFSYFGTIIKHYLIANKNKNYKKKIQHTSIEDILGFEFDLELFEDHESDAEFKSYEYLLQHVADEIEEMLQTDMNLHPNIYKVGEAITYILKNYQYVSISNKRQFYFITREFTGLQAKEITKALKKIKEVFRETYKSMY